MLIHRTRNYVGKQGVAAHDTNAGFIAAGFDAEHDWLLGATGRQFVTGQHESHHDRVDAIGLIVVFAHIDANEAELAVKLLRNRIVGANLEEHLGRA